MANQPAVMEVSICNTPAVTGVMTGAVTDTESAPIAADIMQGSRTTTGTLFTVPAGRVWRGSISLASSISVAGNASCSVSGAAVIHQLPLVGLALVAVSSANTLDNVYIHGGGSGQAVTFTAGASGNSSASAAGRLL